MAESELERYEVRSSVFVYDPVKNKWHERDGLLSDDAVRLVDGVVCETPLSQARREETFELRMIRLQKQIDEQRWQLALCLLRAPDATTAARHGGAVVDLVARPASDGAGTPQSREMDLRGALSRSL